MEGTATNSEPRSTTRRRMRTSTTPSAYRLHFSCDYTGKYVASSKRKIVWRFGFTNLTSLREGKEGRECRGEEHEIVLIWSVQSGKTRVFWNSSNISHLFREEQRFDRVVFGWESRSGAKFKIVAHAKPVASEPQYNVFVDGTSFVSLPHVSDLAAFHVPAEDVASDSSSSVPDLCGEEPAHGSVYLELPPELTQPPKDLGLRLSIGGFAPETTAVVTFDDLEDELTSEFKTNNLESLRHRVTSSIPGTEDLVSRAIVNAFSDDRDSHSSFESSSCGSMPQTPIDFEAEALWETNDWISLNVDYAPRPDVGDQKRVYLQGQIDSIFMHTRHGRIGEDAAVSILVNVATLLGLLVVPTIANDTLIIDALEKRVEVNSIIDVLCEYGEVKEAAICSAGRFGVCRFLSEQGLSRAWAAAEKGLLLINGKQPVVSQLKQRLLQRPKMMPRRIKSEPNSAIPKPTLGRRRSHQRNTITIDSSMAQTPFFNLMDQPPVVTPDPSRSTLRPNDFAVIPARNSPVVFDAAVIGSEISRYSPPSMIVRE